MLAETWFSNDARIMYIFIAELKAEYSRTSNAMSSGRRMIETRRQYHGSSMTFQHQGVRQSFCRDQHRACLRTVVIRSKPAAHRRYGMCPRTFSYDDTVEEYRKHLVRTVNMVKMQQSGVPQKK